MPINDLFSKRQKRNLGEASNDVFHYGILPEALRVQIVTILKETLGLPNPYKDYGFVLEVFKKMNDILCREYGLFNLPYIHNSMPSNYAQYIYDFILECDDVDRAFDAIELCFIAVNTIARESAYQSWGLFVLNPDQAIEELNARFLDHGVGFQFENDQIIKMDNKFAHKEIIKPALKILNKDIYTGANDEFLNAHEHYRRGRNKECLNECLKALESTMKIICKKQNWIYKETDTASKLIEVCFQNKLIPVCLQSQFNSLQSSLGSGVPTIRNKMSGHGQGDQQIDVPDYMASYMLNLTATSILLLANAEEKLP